MATREQFENGSLALFWKPNEKERVIYVKHRVADRGNGSPTLYAVWCTETGYEFTVECCWLQPVEVEGEVCCEELIEENIKSEGPPNANPEANTSSSGESIEDVTPSTSGERFGNVNEEELDELADSRLASNTKEQTKWAVQTLRGK